MVEHIVFFQLEGIEESDVETLCKLANEFPKEIGGIKQISFGRNFAPARAQGFNFALRVL